MVVFGPKDIKKTKETKQQVVKAAVFGASVLPQEGLVGLCLLGVASFTSKCKNMLTYIITRV